MPLKLCTKCHEQWDTDNYLNCPHCADKRKTGATKPGPLGSVVLPGCMATKFLREEEGPVRYGVTFGYGREKYYFERHEVKHIAEELISVINKWENE